MIPSIILNKKFLRLSGVSVGGRGRDSSCADSFPTPQSQQKLDWGNYPPENVGQPEEQCQGPSINHTRKSCLTDDCGFSAVVDADIEQTNNWATTNNKNSRGKMRTTGIHLSFYSLVDYDLCYFSLLL